MAAEHGLAEAKQNLAMLAAHGVPAMKGASEASSQGPGTNLERGAAFWGKGPE